MTRVTYSAISSFSRVRILFLLQARPERTVTELDLVVLVFGTHAAVVVDSLFRFHTRLHLYR